MATTVTYPLVLLTNYTNAQEATYATALSGFPSGAAVIYNTDLGLARIWNGSAFANAPTAIAAQLPLVSTIAQGVVPSTGVASGKFLKDDLTWTTIPGGGDMLGSNNLSDLTNFATARDNLGVEIGVDVQAFLVSATNIKTINGSSILGGGDLSVSGALTTGTTVISGGSNTKVLYNNSGILGEYTISGSGNVAMTTSPVFTTPNIGSATGSVSGNAGTATALQTGRNIGGVSFDGTAAIVPQTIESANEATDTTCFPLFITASGTQSLQPKNNTTLTFNSNTGSLGASLLTGTTSVTSASILASSNDSGALGASGTAFSDLFLASGALINFNAGNATITHSAALLTSNVNIAVPDEAFGSTWNGSVNVPTKNAIFDAFISTSGVGTSPTASQTDSVTHGLGRTPTIIRIYGIGTFTSSASATPTTMSIGIWNSSGNRSIYQAYNTAAITTTQASATSTTFAINLQTGANSFISGVIQNVGATTFDIVWTETGTSSAQKYLWEAE